MAHAGGQADARPVDTSRQPDHRHLAMMTARVHDARLGRTGGHLVAAAEPPGRRGRVPRPRGGARRGPRSTQAPPVRPPSAAAAAAAAPRRSETAARCCWVPLREQRDDAGVRLPAPRSRRRAPQIEISISADLAKTVITIDAAPGETVRITKLVAYHSSTGVPAAGAGRSMHSHVGRAVSDGPEKILDRAAGVARRLLVQQRRRAARRRGRPAGRALEPVPTRASSGPDPGAGHLRQGGHRWRVRRPLLLGHRAVRHPVPGLHDPDVARKLLRFRWRHAAKALDDRAAELNQRGALYPWRTINGEEASAYYAAGTAQYHINAAVAYSVEAVRRRQRRCRASWSTRAPR